MEKPLPPAALILLTTLLVSTVDAVITDQELDSAIAYLRSNGYNLYANAVATSDLRYQILAGDAFTIFCPRDSDVFSLDLASVASDYVQNLRHHVAPGFRLSFFQLRNLSLAGSHLQTLLPRHTVFISNRLNDTILYSVEVDGVPISVPDLYLGSRLAVHGLDGILVSEIRSSPEVSTCDRGCMAPSVWPDGNLSPISSQLERNLGTPMSSPSEENVSPDLARSGSLPPMIGTSRSKSGRGKHSSQVKKEQE